MASLLDMFGTGGTQTLGLLGGDIEAARNDAQAQALYALAGSLLSGGPTGLSIAKGLQQGQQAYRQAMRGSLEDQLQSFQVSDLMRKRKLEEEALKRKELAQQILMRGYVPQSTTTEYERMTPQQLERAAEPGFEVPQTTTVTPAGYDISRVAPLLMSGAAGQEGIDALLKQLNLQKAMAGDLTTLAPEATLIRTNPLTRTTEIVAVGATKAPKLTDTEGNIAKFLYGTDDVEKIRAIPGAVDTIRKEATAQRLLNKPQINMSDPTAVQGQQLKTINQWEGLLNQNKTQELADRANSFYNAYNLSLKGNTNADGAMIYSVAKVYDPGGVVQAGDVSTVVGVRSIPSNIQLMAKKIAEGGTLLPKERENLKEIIDGIVDTKKKAIQPSLENYRKINQSLGGSPDAIVNPLDMIEKPKSLDQILGGRR